jgi:hypothetical protein
MNLWLSPEILSWNMGVLNPRTSPDLDFLKPYDLFRHAKKRLGAVDDKENPDQENPALAEVVYHLRRAIEHREKQLADKFNLSGLPFEVPSNKKNPRIDERLYQLDIIQPILLRKLNDLRNLITHEQKDPSGKDKLLINELSEFTWYFIRSTDSFLGRNISGIIFYPPDFSEPGPNPLVDGYDESYEYDGCFLVRISPKHKWQVNIDGHGVPVNLFSKQEKKDWLQLVVRDFDDWVIDEELGLNPFDILLSLVDDIPKEVRDAEKDAEREKRLNKYLLSSDNIKHFEGTINGHSKAVNYIIKEYFELYMYY